MEEARSERKEEVRKWRITRALFVEELKKASYIAAPMVAVSVLQYLLQVVSVIIVGHLGDQLALSSVAIATSLTNVLGFSLLSGMASGLETLCGQAYGAEQYHKLGTYTYTGIISLIMICPPICLLWIFMDKLLILIGQDPLISHEACKYSIWLIPALFGSAILKPLTRFLQTQSVILPMLLSSLFILILHTIACWIFVYKLELGYKGTALAFDLSVWLNVVLLGFYVKFSFVCSKTRSPFSKDVFYGIGTFFRLGVPSAVMVCLKWWSMELLTLLSGLLSNPKLETSVLSICLTISTLHFTIPYGFGVAASTRVSNELGAGNPDLARLAVVVAICLAGAEAAIVSTTLFALRHRIGYAYSNDKQVVNYVSIMAPLISLSVIMDSLQAVLSGVARGCGWQKIGAYINLGAFYVFGLPVGTILGFVAHLRGKGLWIGILTGSIVQSTLLSFITASTNWKKQAIIKENMAESNVGSSVPILLETGNSKHIDNEDDENGNDDAAKAANDLNQTAMDESNIESSVPLLPEFEGNDRNGNVNYGFNQRATTLERIERIFLIMNFIIEVSTAVFDQLSSVHKPQYALISMSMSFTVLLMSIMGIVYKGKKERVKWMKRGKILWFYYPSPSHKPFGAFPDVIGLVCALFQCVSTTISYGFLSRHADNPIKISLWPIIFAAGLLCSGFIGNVCSRGKSNVQLEMLRGLEHVEMAPIDHRWNNRRKGVALEHLEMLRRLEQLEMLKNLGKLNLLEMLSANADISFEQLERQ